MKVFFIRFDSGQKRNPYFHFLAEVEKSIYKTYIHLYSIDKEEMDYVTETFPIAKRKDVEKHGTYRITNTIFVSTQV